MIPYLITAIISATIGGLLVNIFWSKYHGDVKTELQAALDAAKQAKDWTEKRMRELLSRQQK